MFTRSRCILLAVLVSLAPAARASEGLNIDFGTSYGAPSASYSGASTQAGEWNVVGLGATALLDLAGVPAAASVTVTGFSGGGSNASVPATDDELLLNDNIFSLTGATWTVDFAGLAPGFYDVFLYAPSNLAVASGDMSVAGVEVVGIPGDGGSVLGEGTSWFRLPVLLLGSTLSLSGVDAGFSGLAGMQLIPSQSPVGFNVDFGGLGSSPVESYPAASNRPGVWNAVLGSSPDLLDLVGAATGVSMTVAFGGTTFPTGTLNSERLLDDFITSANPGVAWAVDFAGLPLGDYTVFIYASSSSTLSTGSLTVDGVSVGTLAGDRSATLIEGVSWMQVAVTVADGTLSISGIAPTKSALAGLQLEFLPPSTTQTYCTAGTSASGCNASIAAVGTASATAPSGFSLDTSSVEGAKNGLYFFGTSGRQANSWGNGTSFQCVVPPVKRAGLVLGVGTNGACDGFFSQDLNALWCPTCPSPAKNPGAGAVVQAQLWHRDALNTSNQKTSLSDAVEFAVSP